MTDQLEEIRDYRDSLYGANVVGPKDLINIRMDALDWLISEIEQLRRIVGKPLGAIWIEVEAQTREQWFGEHNVREENRRLRAALRGVLNHIGPHGAPPDCSNDCEGCRAEMAEASRIAEEALATATRLISDPPEGERP